MIGILFFFWQNVIYVTLQYISFENKRYNIDKTDDKKVFTREEIGNYERLHYNNSILV